MQIVLLFYNYYLSDGAPDLYILQQNLFYHLLHTKTKASISIVIVKSGNSLTTFTVIAWLQLVGFHFTNLVSQCISSCRSI
jgi:hypothetical protein